ncbi:MAG: GxxExxY protein, partial [Planctomycetota bacterium]
MEINQISGQVVDAAMKMHSALGPGLLESAYEASLVFDLHRRGLKALSQLELPVVYGSVKIDVGYRMDILVEDAVIVELKSVEKILPIHKAQLLSYLHLRLK